MRMVDFIAEQNRLDRTRGLKRTDPGGEVEPQDYPLSKLEREFFEREYTQQEEEYTKLLEEWHCKEEEDL